MLKVDGKRWQQLAVLGAITFVSVLLSSRGRAL